jgi:hypothetical protein
MQLHATRFFIWLKKACHRIRHHLLEFVEGISLRGDASTSKRIVPAGDVAAADIAGFDNEGDSSFMVYS